MQVECRKFARLAPLFEPAGAGGPGGEGFFASSSISSAVRRPMTVSMIKMFTVCSSLVVVKRILIQIGDGMVIGDGRATCGGRSQI